MWGKMAKYSDLLGIKYLEGEYWLFTRSLWLNILKKDLNNNQYSKPLFTEIKPCFLKLIEWNSKAYPFLSSLLNDKKRIWIGPGVDKYDHLFKYITHDLIISKLQPSFSFYLKLFFTSNLYYNPVYACLNDLFSGIVNNNENLLQQGMDQLKTSFDNMNPDLIVLNDDVFPSHRAIVLVAQELGIPTVEIQHGIYMSDLPTGREADYVFVWGEYFKDLYVNNKIKKSNQVKVLGYPYIIQNCDNNYREKKRVTYLGQSFELYDESLLSSKLETIIKLQEICNKLNFDFVYRPHPVDDLNLLKSKLKNVNFTPHGETWQKSLEKGDIFISFNSTALVEASLHSKLSIQLKSYDMSTDDFEKLGACSKSVETFEELEIYLEKIRNDEVSSWRTSVKDSYIEIPSPNPETRFLELIQDII